MNYTKGFYLLECSCNNIDEYVNTVSEGKYSYIDWTDISSNNIDPCETNPIYELDDCRIEKGLIVPLAKIDPTHKERKYKYPIPIKKTSECCKPPINNVVQPEHHDIADDEFHQHYFPLNTKIVNYGHTHESLPHSEIYPHMNKDATNMYTLMHSLKQVHGDCCEDNDGGHPDGHHHIGHTHSHGNTYVSQSHGYVGHNHSISGTGGSHHHH